METQTTTNQLRSGHIEEQDLSLDAPIANLPPEVIDPPPAPPPPAVADFEDPEYAPQAPQDQQKERSRLQTAFEGARHYAGGLVSRPVEITKEHTVLRHSHGLVYYQGPATNVAITIFSKHALPENRTIWLQKKGWFGKSGWAARAIVKANGSWMDVTPDQYAGASVISPTNERAWQRDIARFQKKASKPANKHSLRETNIIRIPFEAGDGYFRLVLCADDSKKILCPSPLFRIASLSTSNASMKGAPIVSLPLEVGITVGQSIAKSHISTITTPITSVVKTAFSPIVPSWVGDTAPLAYSAGSHVAGHKSRSSDATASFAQPDEMLVPLVGPMSPFPLKLKAKFNTASKGCITLTSLPEPILRSLTGAFFAWIAIDPPSPTLQQRLSSFSLSRKDSSPTSPLSRTMTATSTAPSSPSLAKTNTGFSTLTQSTTATSVSSTSTSAGVEKDWLHSILYISPPSSTGSIVPVKEVQAHLPFLPEEMDLSPNSQVHVLVAGYLHHITSSEDRDMEIDVAMTASLLDLPGFSAEECLSLVKEREKNRSLGERYSDARTATQGIVAQVPVHRVGIRGWGDGERERGLRGGVCIRRE